MTKLKISPAAKAASSRTMVAPAPSEAEALSHVIVQGMLEKKAQRVAVLDLRGLPEAVADFFIIGSGGSDTQVDAIVDSVEEQVWKETSQNPWHREGKGQKEWVLLDYTDCVAHVFKPARRRFYALEQLWGDAPITWYGEDGQPTDNPPPDLGGDAFGPGQAYFPDYDGSDEEEDHSSPFLRR